MVWYASVQLNRLGLSSGFETGGPLTDPLLVSYATYIPSAHSLLPQHTLPLNWAQRYTDPTIHT